MFTIAALFAGLTAGQPPARAESLAERAFLALREQGPANKADSRRTVEDPPTLPALPLAFKFERKWQNGQSCGPVALYFLLRLQGQRVQFDDVIGSITTTEKGCSLADLEAAATKFGLKTRAVKLTPEQIGELPTPAIIHFTTPGDRTKEVDHFDLFLGESVADDGNSYEFIDTTNCIKYRQTAGAIGPKLSGYALIADSVSSNGTRGYALLWSGAVTVIALDMVLLGLIVRRSVGGRARWAPADKQPAAAAASPAR
jgi:hypothetical protein